ncbi:hypothetical protein F511_37592 [Dorcoceras hygrometricum]|uniref:Uncharacterized protein n=1 Tax=Dorcoceras hygrometricum TaxID=472368 RepID=A0A2Z7DEY3_9LAMI|nr:hypothetical protein F511_37592 [Dorcoceras hygrometricum]
MYQKISEVVTSLRASKKIRELKISAVVTSSKLIEDFSNRDVIESWAAVRCIRSDTQPSDVAFTKEHQNDAASTNQNDAAALQQPTTDSFLINQQLVTLSNSNDDVSGTRHHRCQQLITKALHQKRCVSTYQNDVASPSAAGHSNQQLVTRLNQFLTNTTADSASTSAVNTKRLTNTCRFLVKSRDCALAANRFLFKRYY